MTKATCLTTVALIPVERNQYTEHVLMVNSILNMSSKILIPFHLANVPSVWIWRLSFACILCCCELICRSWRSIVSPLDRDFSITARSFGGKVLSSTTLVDFSGNNLEDSTTGHALLSKLSVNLPLSNIFFGNCSPIKWGSCSAAKPALLQAIKMRTCLISSHA